jgi:hypothetical protein
MLEVGEYFLLIPIKVLSGKASTNDFATVNLSTMRIFTKFYLMFMPNPKKDSTNCSNNYVDKQVRYNNNQCDEVCNCK